MWPLKSVQLAYRPASDHMISLDALNQYVSSILLRVSRYALKHAFNALQLEILPQPSLPASRSARDGFRSSHVFPGHVHSLAYAHSFLDFQEYVGAFQSPPVITHSLNFSFKVSNQPTGVSSAQEAVMFNNYY